MKIDVLADRARKGTAGATHHCDESAPARTKESLGSAQSGDWS